MSITVFTTSELLAAFNATPDGIINFSKKPDDKSYKGTKFVNVTWNIGDKKKASGWFGIGDIPLSNGVADPKDTADPRNEFEGTRLQLQTTLSQAGEFGKFLVAFNPHWRKAIQTWSQQPGNLSIGSRKIHDLLQDKLSERNEKNPNAPIEDPIIRFKMDFSKFPAKFRPACLAGQQRTQIYDYRQRYTDENEGIRFRAAMIRDPATGADVPVTEHNVHLFITRNSIIRYARLYIQSVPFSSSWVSLPMLLTTVVVEPGGPEVFLDNMLIANSKIAAAANNNLAQTQPKPQDQNDQSAIASTAATSTSINNTTVSPSTSVNDVEVEHFLENM